MMLTEDFIRFEREKAKAYNIFTALLCQPTEELITDHTIFFELCSSLEIICPQCTEIAREMGNHVKKYSQKELLVEYTRLFIGPFKLLAPPYSCIYFGVKDLMSDETLWVINFYEKVGLAFDNSLKDSPDHIAIETEFLYYLVYNGIKEFEEGKLDNAFKFWDGHSEFFSSHYKVWVPKFAEKIIDNSNNDFYKSLAASLTNFVSTMIAPQFPGR